MGHLRTLRRGGQDVVPDELRVGLHVARVQHCQGEVDLAKCRGKWEFHHGKMGDLSMEK